MRFLKKKTTDNPHLYITNSGCRKKKVLSPIYDGRKMTLVESGEIDIQDMINSHGPECDINLILTRLQHGDFSGLNASKPMFADFHNLPTNFREVLDVALSSERIFNDLPVELRRDFDNDYRRFVSSAGSKEWLDIMSSHGVELPSVKPAEAVPGSSSDGGVSNA